MNQWIKRLVKAACVLGIMGIGIYLATYMITGQSEIRTKKSAENSSISDWSETGQEKNDAMVQSNGAYDFNREIIKEGIYRERFDQIQTVQMTVSNGDIEIKPTAEEQFILEIESCSNAQIAVNEEAGVLTVSVNCSSKTHGKGQDDEEITLYVPHGRVLEQSVFQIETGDIEIETGTWNDLQATASIGDIQLDQVVVNGAMLSVQTGDIGIEGMVSKTIEATCSNGEIELELSNSLEQLTGKLQISTTGKIKINDAESAQSTVELTGAQPEAELKISVERGEIELETFGY